MRRLVLAVVLALVATGCATTARTSAAPAGVDISGQWVGRWSGYGIVDIAREQDLRADFTQFGEHGRGRIIFDGVNSAETVPLSLRDAGAMGIRVVLRVSGSDVLIEHELGGNYFTAKLQVDGDRMTGRVNGAYPAVNIILVRAPLQLATMPTRRSPVPTPPSATMPPSVPMAPLPALRPPPPTQVGPEPPKTPEVAVAPTTPGSAPGSQPSQDPASSRPAPQEFQTIIELKPIYFDFDKADIRPDDTKNLDAGVQWLKDNPAAQVLIEGHADERGTSEYNLALGERRARAAREYLVSHGVPGDRVSTVSYGEQRPACVDKNEACWTLNRRAEFLVKPQ